MFARQLAVFSALIVATAGLQCYSQNQVTGYTQTLCPTNIYQCMKFTCTMGGGGQQITKGCNDPNNPQTACATLTANCATTLQGQGQCYTCNNDNCNGAETGSVMIVIASIASYFYLTL